MAREKQHVFSARTTEEGLRQLNELKGRLKVGWDDLVIDAVCERYGLDRAVMAPPKKEAPTKPARNETEQPAVAEQVHPTDDRPPKKKGKGKGKK